MIKISRISSPLKEKVKNLETCSQLDGDGVFEGGIINVAGMKQIDLTSDKVVEIMQKVSE